MISIRQAELTDLDSLRKLNEKIFIDNPKYDDDFITNFALTEEGKKYFEEAIERKDGYFLVAEEDNEMVGYINGGTKDAPYRKSRYFEIENLGVVPEQKGKGIGKMLLEKITSWAKEHGYQKIYLNCYAKNSEALAFYRHNGYLDIDICLEKII